MSDPAGAQFRRTDPRGGWVNPSKLPKGPNGRALCRQCGREVPKGRRTFCSDACVDEWMVRTSATKARALVFKRDRGVCALCGWDTHEFAGRWAALKAEADRRWRGSYARGDDGRERYVPGDPAWSPFAGGVGGRGEAYRAVRDALFAEVGLDGSKYAHRRTFWDMDHIRPVVEGGGSCGLDNLRTLCIKCHGRVTAELAARRAAQRRGDASPSLFDPPEENADGGVRDHQPE